MNVRVNSHAGDHATTARSRQLAREMDEHWVGGIDPLSRLREYLRTFEAMTDDGEPGRDHTIMTGLAALAIIEALDRAGV